MGDFGGAVGLVTVLVLAIDGTLARLSIDAASVLTEGAVVLIEAAVERMDGAIEGAGTLRSEGAIEGVGIFAASGAELGPAWWGNGGGRSSFRTAFLLVEAVDAALDVRDRIVSSVDLRGVRGVGVALPNLLAAFTGDLPFDKPGLLGELFGVCLMVAVDLAVRVVLTDAREGASDFVSASFGL